MLEERAPPILERAIVQMPAEGNQGEGGTRCAEGKARDVQQIFGSGREPLSHFDRQEFWAPFERPKDKTGETTVYVDFACFGEAAGKTRVGAFAEWCLRAFVFAWPRRVDALNEQLI